MPGKDPPNVQIPGGAVAEGAEAQDLRQPVRELLEGLNLFDPDENAGTGFRSTFTGPPQSVALIEAGATAAAKWWATGLGAAVIVLWSSIIGWWNKTANVDVRVTVIAGGALVTAALILAIAHLLASDVRGRAEASVAIIDARTRLAEAMIGAVQNATPQLVPLQGRSTWPLMVIARNHTQPKDEDGWIPVAMERLPNGQINYVLQKGTQEQTVPADQVEFHA